MARWKRPYAAGGSTFLAGFAFWAVGVICFIIGAVGLGVMLYTRDFTPKEGWAFVPVVAGWLTLMWRVYRTGVFVSDDALRVRTMFRTRTLAWRDIGSFTVGPSFWGFGECLWVVHKHGHVVETPVRRRQQFALHAASVMWSNTGQTYLWPADFELLTQALNRRIGR